MEENSHKNKPLSFGAFVELFWCGYNAAGACLAPVQYHATSKATAPDPDGSDPKLPTSPALLHDAP
jgi:hypothetical protein